MFCRRGQMDNTSADKTAKCKQINSRADKTYWIKLWITGFGSTYKWSGAEAVEGRDWYGEEIKDNGGWGGLAVSRNRKKIANMSPTARWKKTTTGWECVKRGKQRWRTRGRYCYSLYEVGPNLLISHLTSMSTLSSSASSFYKTCVIREREHILCFSFPCTVTITTRGSDHRSVATLHLCSACALFDWGLLFTSYFLLLSPVQLCSLIPVLGSAKARGCEGASWDRCNTCRDSLIWPIGVNSAATMCRPCTLHMNELRQLNTTLPAL